MNEKIISERFRVLILGGGIHGVGLLHDLSSRGWKDCLLLEKGQLGQGTSSRSTKLVHGGLRYLQRISQFHMVSQSLRERALLMELAGDLVHPVRLVIPTRSLIDRIKIKIGLMLYDLLSGKRRIGRHRKVAEGDFEQSLGEMQLSEARTCYEFWDGQTDDLALVNRVAASSRVLGAEVRENSKVLSIKRETDGWQVEYEDTTGTVKVVSCRYLVNALGPWSNEILEKSDIAPLCKGINNRGIHLIMRDLGLKAGLFLPEKSGNRIFFVLPWKGKTLVGTTEATQDGSPDALEVPEFEVEYLLENLNFNLKNTFTKDDVEATFSGLRWLAVEDNQGISATSRESVITEHDAGRGILFTIYGGKLTSYRSLCEKIGDKICKHFGEFQPTQTDSTKSWFNDEVPPPELSDRFSSRL